MRFGKVYDYNWATKPNTIVNLEQLGILTCIVRYTDMYSYVY